MTSIVPRNHRPVGYAGDLNVSPNACIIPWAHNVRKRWSLRDVASRSLVYSLGRTSTNIRLFAGAPGCSGSFVGARPGRQAHRRRGIRRTSPHDAAVADDFAAELEGTFAAGGQPRPIVRGERPGDRFTAAA